MDRAWPLIDFMITVKEYFGASPPQFEIDGTDVPQQRHCLQLQEEMRAHHLGSVSLGLKSSWDRGGLYFAGNNKDVLYIGEAGKTAANHRMFCHIEHPKNERERTWPIYTNQLRYVFLNFGQYATDQRTWKKLLMDLERAMLITYYQTVGRQPIGNAKPIKLSDGRKYPIISLEEMHRLISNRTCI